MILMNNLKFSIALLVMLNLFLTSECIATYSIDLSSEFIKVAIVKPGVPMEIALDKESQRKTPSVVYISENERLFGNAALNMGVKFPKNLYHSITTLVGKTIDHPIVQQFIKNFPYYEIFMDKNNQLAFKHDKNTEFTVEELLAMILENAKSIAESYAEMQIKSGIIVIPPYFTQEERLAIMRAARIGGINVLQLMNSNAAVALNYGIFRRKSFNSTVQYYMFYDVGSSSTIASIASYQVVKTKEFGMMVENPQLAIVGLGYNRTLGISQFTLRLQKHLANVFNSQMKPAKDVTTIPRSMAKLYKEASRVIKVLSANNEIYAQVENVYDEKDLKVKITRSQFEEMCQDLFDSFTEPIMKSLESAQIPMVVIKEIILMGGGTRIPKLQSILLKATDMKELGKSINTDEAAALGAVYQSAYVSPGFKVKTFVVKDANLVPITVDFIRFKIQENAEVPHFTSRVLFDFMNFFPVKRVLTFNKHSKNFNFNVTLGTYEDDKKTLFQVEVNNLTEVYNGLMETKDYLTEFKGVKAHFGLDNSGIISLNYIEAIFDRQENGNKTESSTFQKIGNTISNLFGSSDEEKEEKSEKSESVTTKSNNSKPDSVVNNGTKNESQEMKPKLETIHQNLNFINTYKGSIIPSEDVIDESRKKVIKLKFIDEEKDALEKAQNELESYIFLVNDQVEKDLYIQCSTKYERRLASSTAKSMSEWYEEQGKDTPKEEYTKRYKELRGLMKDIDFRVQEYQSRPEAISKMNAILNTSNVFLTNLQNLTGEGKILTRAEYDLLAKLLIDTTKWFESANKTFDSMRLDVNPTITTSDFDPHINAIKREIGYLVNKITIWNSQPPPPPPSSNTSSDNKTTDESKDNAAESEKNKETSEDKKQKIPKPDLPSEDDSVKQATSDKNPEKHEDL